MKPEVLPLPGFHPCEIWHEMFWKNMGSRLDLATSLPVGGQELRLQIQLDVPSLKIKYILISWMGERVTGDQRSLWRAN